MKFIKPLILITLVLSHFTLFAQDIEVMLMDGSKLDCSASTSIPAACLDQQGNRYLVEANENFANAIKFDSEGRSQFTLIKEVKWDDQLIYASAPMPPGFQNMPGMGGYGPANFTTPPPTYRSDLLNASSTLGNTRFTQERTTDPAALALLAQMRQNAETTLAQAQSVVEADAIEMELSEDEERASCQRLAANGEVFPCNIYRCSSPSAGFYVDTGYGVGSFISLDNNNHVSALKGPKAIWNPENRDKPIAAKFETFGMGMGGYAPAPLGQGQYDFARQSRRQAPNIPTLEAQGGSSLIDPMFRMSLVSYAQSCKKEQVGPLVSAIEKIREDVAQAEMVQLVEVTNNILTSRFINPGDIPDNACSEGDTWYRGQSYDLSRDLLADSSPKTIDMETATRLFNEARAMEDIAWNYKMDGCYARAHLMARRFEAQGIHVDKVWIKGDLRVPEANIQWNFHVAPIVYVEDASGNVQKMVIDPSLMDGPVPVAQWSAKMEKGVVGQTVETSFPFPQNAMNLERTAITYSNSDPYLPTDQVSMSEEEKMDQSVNTMTRYLGFSQ